MNLVVGATGLLGEEICRKLSREGKAVKALIRTTSDKTKVERLKEIGATLVYGDLKDPDSLKKALPGVNAVFSTASSTFSRQEGDSIQTVDIEGQLNLINAAKSAAIDRFIFISFRENPGNLYPLTIAKRTVEKQLKESGINYTGLQAGYFMEVWLSPALGFDFPNAKARIYGAGTNKLSWISYKDVAQFAVKSLDNPAASNAILEIGGPEALSPNEVVRIFEEVSKKSFDIEYIPEETLKAQKAEASDPLQKSFAALMLQYANGDDIDMEETLKVFPLQLTSVSEYAQSMLSN
jgi:NADH dehydrogenase